MNREKNMDLSYSKEDGHAEVTPAHLNMLTKATITYDYLNANSTTHDSLFGAMAELVDNARDAEATRLDINIEKHGDLTTIYFLDDGCGMSKEEVASTMAFGHSVKRMDDCKIGQYGNGLKSGALRIGRNFMVFTKKDKLLTAMLLSRNFHEENNLKSVFVPMPSFNQDRLLYSVTQDEEEKEKTKFEMSIIYKYSPFKNFDEFFQQFSYIIGDSGTVIICFNLRFDANTELEIDIESDVQDIRLRNYKSRGPQEVVSLRDYLSLLYSKPRMLVYIRDGKVDTRPLISLLYQPRRYEYRAKNLRAYAQKEIENCEKRVADLKDFVKVRTSDYSEYQNSLTKASTNRFFNTNERIRANYLLKLKEEASAMLNVAEEKVKAAKKAKSNPKPIMFYFGINILRRSNCGCLVYNNGRLISLYEQTACQKLRECLGICGIVDVPYSILEPTHNKQSFANKNDFLSLMNAFNKYMKQYWLDVKIENNLKGFWENYGYGTSDWDDVPAQSEEFIFRRNVQVGVTVQCYLCHKWRQLPFQRSYLTNFPEEWHCELHPDGKLRSCNVAESESKVIPMGRLTDAAKDKVGVVSKSAVLPKAEPEPLKWATKVVQPSRNRAPVRNPPYYKDLNEDEEEEDEEEEPDEYKPSPKKERKAHARTPVRRKSRSPGPSALSSSTESSVAGRARASRSRKAAVPEVPLRRTRRSPTPVFQGRLYESEAQRREWRLKHKPPQSEAPAVDECVEKSRRRKRKSDPAPEESAPLIHEPTVSVESPPNVSDPVPYAATPDSASNSQLESIGASDNAEQLAKALEVIRGLIMTHVPENMSKAEVLTMTSEDLLNYDVGNHDRQLNKGFKKIAEKLRGEWEQKKQALSNHLKRLNVAENDVKKIVSDL